MPEAQAQVSEPTQAPGDYWVQPQADDSEPAPNDSPAEQAPDGSPAAEVLTERAARLPQAGYSAAQVAALLAGWAEPPVVLQPADLVEAPDAPQPAEFSEH